MQWMWRKWTRVKSTCHGCGMRGHMKKYFWEYAANTRKRSEGWKYINYG